MEALLGVDGALLKNAHNEEGESKANTTWIRQEPQIASTVADMIKTYRDSLSNHLDSLRA